MLFRSTNCIEVVAELLRIIQSALALLFAYSERHITDHCEVPSGFKRRSSPDRSTNTSQVGVIHHRPSLANRGVKVTGLPSHDKGGGTNIGLDGSAAGQGRRRADTSVEYEVSETELD